MFSDDEDSDLPDDAADTIATRTPGFSGWQQEVWLSHCGDGVEFLGRAGAVELAAYPDALVDILPGLPYARRLHGLHLTQCRGRRHRRE